MFCNDPEPFTLVLNGIVQNQTPATSVRAEGLTLKVYQARIIFQNHKKKDHNTTITFFSTNTECVFALNPHGKKKYTCDYLSSKPIVPVQQNTVADTSSKTNISGNNSSQNNSSQNNNTGYQPQKINLPPISSGGFTTLVSSIVLLTDITGKKNNVLSILEKSAMNTQQVTQLLNMVDNPEYKLQIAKKAFLSVTDPQNYSSVINSFITDDKESLQNFINSVAK